MRSRTLLILFSAAAALSLIAFAPLSLLAGEGLASSGVRARAIDGTIWNGTLRDAAWRGEPLGDVRVRIAPLGLLVGRPGLRFHAKGAALGTGVIEAGRRSAGLADADLTLPSRLAAPRAPLDGQIVLRDFTARFDRGRCAAARGQARFEVARIGGAPAPNVVLSGRPACEDGFLVLPLSGEARGAKIDARLRLDGAGRYRLETRVVTTDANLGLALGLAGFERMLDGSRRVDEGRIADADR